MILSPEYVAGLFDGEGMVSVIYAKRKKWKTNPQINTYGFKIVIGISNTYKPIIDMLKKQFDGDISASSRISDRHKTVWSWKVTSKETQKKFLEYIKDDVIIKKEQVSSGLVFIDTMVSPGSRITQENWETRISVYNRLREINRAGNFRKTQQDIPLEARELFRPSRFLTKEEIDAHMDMMRASKKTT